MKKSTISLINITVYAGNVYLNKTVDEVCEKAQKVLATLGRVIPF
jgi:hypothetical protein